jgi:hypothetical protein
LRRLSAEQGKKSGTLAAQTLRLLPQAIELGLLLCRRLFGASDLLGLCRIESAAVDRGQLAFEPQTDRITHGRHGSRRGGRGSRRRRDRKSDLR